MCIYFSIKVYKNVFILILFEQFVWQLYALGVRSEWYMYTMNVTLPRTIIYAKFSENIFLNIKVFHTSTWFWSISLYGSYILLYSSSISVARTIEQLLEEKRTCEKFRIAISKTEAWVRVYKMVKPTWLNWLSSSHWSFILYRA